MANTYLDYYQLTAGVKQDLLDVITMITRDETPVLSTHPKSTPKSVLHEWLTDALAAPAANAVVEGTAATFTSLTTRTKIQNYTQISRKTFSASSTTEWIDLAGVRNNEYSWQMAKMTKELVRDVEYALVNNTASASGASATARQTQGMAGAITATDLNLTATADRYLSNPLFDDALEACWEKGIRPDICYARGFQLRQIGAFQTPNQRIQNVTGGAIHAEINTYVTNFGTIGMVVHYIMDKDKVYILDKSYWRIAIGQPLKHTELGADGSGRRGQVESEYCLEYRHPDAGSVIKNLLTVSA